MDKLFSKYRWLRVVSGILYLIAGILIIVMAIVNVGKLGMILSIIAAIFLFLLGGLMIAASMVQDRKSFFSSPLAFGALLIAFGILLCMKTSLLGEVIKDFVSVFAIAFGVVELIRGVVLAVNHGRWYYYVLAFVVGALAITFGILTLTNVFPGDDILRIVYIVAGLFIAGFGVLEIVVGAKLMKR